MGRYTGPKNKLSRREGIDLFGKNKESLNRRLTKPPGQNTQIKRSYSEFALQLREKQKVKRLYGLRERQFRRFFRQALQISKNHPELSTGLIFLQLLERRLDNVVYRLGLAKTRNQARQFVTQKKVLVNNRIIDIPSYLVEINQKVTVIPEMFDNPLVQSNIQSVLLIPEWLTVEGKEGHILRYPIRDEISSDINENMIVEYYYKRV